MLKEFIRRKFLTLTFIASFSLIIAGFLWALFALRNIEQPLIVHFTAFTITETGTLLDLFVIDLLAAMAAGVNFFLAFELEKREKLLGRLAATVTLFISLLIFIGFKVIISVNLVQ